MKHVFDENLSSGIVIDSFQYKMFYNSNQFYET